LRIIFIIPLILFYYGALAQGVNNFIAKGNDLYKKGDYKQAQVEYEKALQADKANGSAQFNDGNALQKMGNYADAGKLFQSVLESSKDPTLQSMSSYNKGVAEVKQQQLQEAVNSFKQSLRLNPADEESRENLQKALNELKKQKDKNQDNNKKPDNKSQKQKPENKISKQQAENLLNQLRQEEKQLHEYQKQKIKQQNPEKDW
jgi:Ca-activated chloride channel family protein